jgi:hypothetical protein
MAHPNQGIIPIGRLGVYVRGGHNRSTLLGTVGPKATSATCRRFGSFGAKLDVVDNRQAWIGDAVPRRSNTGDEHERRKRTR